MTCQTTAGRARVLESVTGRTSWPALTGTPMPFTPIPEILQELKAGRPIVLVDDEDRENEGDVVYAAETCDADAVNFMVKHARGVVCLALTNEQCDRLRLEPQTPFNTAQLGTAF